MYDINLKNVKKGYGFFAVFLGVGILFLLIIGGILGSSIVYKNSLDASTMSKSVEIDSYTDDEGDTMYNATYYYYVKGKEYVCKNKSSSSISPSSDNKTIYYSSKNPEKCMSESDTNSSKFLYLFMLLPIIFIIVGWINIRKVSKRVKLIKELNNHGKLVKNLPYRMEPTGMSVNDVQIMKPVVDYVLPSGNVVTLAGDPRHDRVRGDSDGMVDLVIDEQNPDNYFIDFEINRLTGNLKDDFYTQNTTVNTVSNDQVQNVETNISNQISNNNPSLGQQIPNSSNQVDNNSQNNY